MNKDWLLLTYDRVETTRFGDPEPTFMRGELADVTLLRRSFLEEPLDVVKAHVAVPGFYAAMPVPDDLTPVEIVLEVADANVSAD